ncbi:MAG: T9SS type A sorting domain-containing protein, partial [Candidatus Kapaibacterium sp.]
SVQFDDLMSIGASIMPNPAGDKLRVVMPLHLHGGSVRVVDAMGRTVVTQSITGGEDSFRLSVAELASGVYRLCIDDASSGSVRSAAFVVAR